MGCSRGLLGAIRRAQFMAARTESVYQWERHAFNGMGSIMMGSHSADCVRLDVESG